MNHAHRSCSAGRSRLAYSSPTVIDPVNNLEVGQIAAGMYREFDAVLKFREVLKESFAPSLEKVAAR